MLKDEDPLAFAGGLGWAFLSARAEMGPGFGRGTQFKPNIWETEFGVFESWNREQTRKHC